MIVGIDIGGTKIAVGAVSEYGQILNKVEFPTPKGRHASLARIKEAVHGFACINTSIRGIGVACTGPVDPKTGIVGDVVLLPGWEGVDLINELATEFDVPVAVENDADAAAIGEAVWGSGKRHSPFIYITISTGIGGGLIIDGDIYRGVDNSHPEMGHHLIDPSGPLCYCGGRGCWEALASGSALSRWYQSQVQVNSAASTAKCPSVDAKKICDLARQGDDIALRATVREGFYLGLGLTNLITVFAPSAIALGGGVMKSWDLFAETVYRTIQQNCGMVLYEKTSLVLAELGDDAGLIGAAQIWLRHFI